MATSLTDIQAITAKEFVPALQLDFVARSPLIKLFDLVGSGKWRINPNITFPRTIAPGELQKSVKGGSYEVHIPIILAAPGKAKSYSGFGDFQLDSSTGLRSAAFDFVSTGRAVSITGIEMEDSRDAVITYAATRLKEAMGDLADSLETQLWSDGTGNSNLDIDGMQILVSDSNTTVGGLAQATYANWRPDRYDSTISNGASTLNLINPMIDCWNNVTLESPPTVIICTTAVKGIYEKAMVKAGSTSHMPWIIQPSAKDDALIKLAIDHVFFNGAPVIASGKAPDYHMYFLNLSYIAFKTKSPKRIEVSKWANLNVLGKDGITCFMKVRGAACIKSVRHQAVITDCQG